MKIYEITINGDKHRFVDVKKHGEYYSAYEINEDNKIGEFLHRLSQKEIDRAKIINNK